MIPNPSPEFLPFSSLEWANGPGKNLPEEELLTQIRQLQEAFQELTGWEVQWPVFAPPFNRGSVSPNRGALREDSFRLNPPSPKKGKKPQPSNRPPSSPLKAAVVQLGKGIGTILKEIARLQEIVWQQAAELATAVPVVADLSGRNRWAERLEAVLRAGGEAVGADAAALYLLDDATTCLKLRSVWGLPRGKLVQPPRPLRGAIADLEALLGHVVVLEDLARMPTWQAPEKGFGAAVCVPVATETTLLGTLWVFSKHPRPFSSQQTNILEVVAGRLAAELERQVLLAEATRWNCWKEALLHLQQWQEDQEAAVAVQGQRWELGLWKETGQTDWGSFFHQFPWGPHATGFLFAQLPQPGIQALLDGVWIRAALEAHACHLSQPHRLLQQIPPKLLCSGQAAERGWAVWLGRVLQPKACSLSKGASGSGKLCLRYAMAGPIGMLRIGPKRWTSFSQTFSKADKEAKEVLDLSRGHLEGTPSIDNKMYTFRCRRLYLSPGELLIVFGAISPRRKNLSSRMPQRSSVLKETESRLAKALREHLDWPAPRLAELTQKLLQKIGQPPAQEPVGVCVIKVR